MDLDPVSTNPDLYRVVMENDRVRVLEYRDRSRDQTIEHAHPDSVMVTLSSFKRRLHANGRETDVNLESGAVRWLAAQSHIGENIGETESHVIFVELKQPRPDLLSGAVPIGPSA